MFPLNLHPNDYSISSSMIGAGLSISNGNNFKILKCDLLEISNSSQGLSSALPLHHNFGIDINMIMGADCQDIFSAQTASSHEVGITQLFAALSSQIQTNSLQDQFV